VPKSGARQPGEGQNSPSAQTCPSQFPAVTRRIWQRLNAGHVKSNPSGNFNSNPNGNFNSNLNVKTAVQ
ncbi:MAG: hypothetical protein WBD81_21995, partial [Collimonas pratensis]|uniref:hypothetical protein n=1 Tax=Collimonas pratensis TaxID=279113 RepID=UPI003C764C81